MRILEQFPIQGFVPKGNRLLELDRFDGFQVVEQHFHGALWASGAWRKKWRQFS